MQNHQLATALLGNLQAVSEASFVNTLEKPKLTPELFKDLHSINHCHYRLLAFITFYVVAVGAAFLLVRMILTPWCYVVCLPLYLLAAASLHGISLFMKEYTVYSQLTPIGTAH